jgi:hypothetical protein
MTDNGNKIYTYAMLNRTFFSGMPEGYLAIDESSVYPHGIIAYPYKLNEDQVNRFELVRLDFEHVVDRAQQVFERMRPNTNQYLEYLGKEEDVLQEYILSRFSTSNYYDRLSIHDLTRATIMVLELLRGEVKA